MTIEMTNCVAIGVPDRAAAVRFYTDVLGFQLGESSESWTEILAGPLKLYLCDDDMPYCMAVNVADVPAAASHLERHGCTRLFESGGEVFYRDPFGTNWCVSPRG
jgi:catechol 2,3-dioxygenase-like lactoylglutathione lyase family enzyme